MSATPITKAYLQGLRPEWWVPGRSREDAERLAEEEATAKMGQFHPALMGAAVMEIPEPDWLLQNFIVEGGLTLLYGAPGSGKSFVALDWANTLASPGMDRWIDFPKALPYYRPYYLYQEGQGGLKGRALAWLKHHNTDEWPAVAWQLRHPVKMNLVQEWTAAQEALFYDFMNQECDILFIDTLSQTFGGNENQQEASQAWLDGINRFRNEGKAVVVIHHTPKDGKSIRGSNVVEAASDIAIKLEGGNTTDTTKFIHVRAKDVENVPPFQLRHRKYDVDTKVGNSIVLVADGAGRGILTTVQQKYWEYIQSDPGCTVTEIAIYMGVKQSAASEMLLKLETFFQVRKEHDRRGDLWYVNEAEEI